MALTTAKPESCAGMLEKQSPNFMRFGSYQRRFFIVQDGILYWSATAEDICEGDKMKGWQVKEGAAELDSCKGTVDFSANLGCEIAEDEDSATRFLLKPKDDKWTKGDFTGSSSGRVFKLDVCGEVPPRGQWTKALRAHIAYGATQQERKGLGPSGKSTGYPTFAANKSAPPAAASEGDQKKAAAKIQRIVRGNQARAQLKGLDFAGAAIAVRRRYQAWSSIFDEVCKKSGAATLNEADFTVAFREVYPTVAQPQVAALWNGYLEGTGSSAVDLAGFCRMAEAMAMGTKVAAEFADISLEAFEALAAKAA